MIDYFYEVFMTLGWAFCNNLIQKETLGIEICNNYYKLFLLQITWLPFSNFPLSSLTKYFFTK